MDNWTKGFLAVLGAVISYLFGGWSALLEALLFLAVVDWLSGFGAAAKEGRLSSHVGAWGIAKKVGMFAVVSIAHMADGIIGDAHLIRDAAIFWYAANELVSIAENLGRLGVPIPPIIAQAVALLRDKGKPAKSS